MHIPFHQITPKTNHIFLRNLLHKLPDVHPSRALHRNQCPLPVHEYLCACICVPISEICFVSCIKTFSAFSRDTAHAVLLSSHTHTQNQRQIWIQARPWVWICAYHVQKFECMHVYKHTHTHARTHARTHTHMMHARTHTRTHAPYHAHTHMTCGGG